MMAAEELRSTPVFHHVPVLRAEVLAALAPRDGEVYVDCTLGGGGHSEALLESARCTVIGIDRDADALAAATARLAPFGARFVPLRGRFSDLGALLARVGRTQVNGVLADLGVSSHQLDTPGRGFSFRFAGPLDMRMDQNAPLSAADLVNNASEEDLADWIHTYGEERHARRVARAIVAGRPWRDTASLAEAVSRAVGGRGQGIHPATRTFQALRIVVNDELRELERLLDAAVTHTAPGGRISIISFHSLEDRIVKRFFADRSGKDAPRDAFGNRLGPVDVSPLSAVTPSDTDPNPRARSARLRSAVRLPWNES